MAEESGGSTWWGGWGNDFLQNIKAKSSETMAMVKQDLSEFMTTVQGDTTSVIADTATAVKDQLKVNEEDQESTSGKLKQGMSDWFGTISSTLKDNLSQVANTAAASFDSPVFDRFQAHLNEIQTDPTTYCSEPDGHPRLYDEWCERFDLEQCKGEISELLVNKPKVRALYTNLVPSAVSHSLFWQRYFYKVHQLNQEEKRRAALVERANKVAEEDLAWGDDEDDDLWGTEGSSADVVQTLANHERPEKVASAIPGDAEQREKTQPSVLGENDVGTQNNRAKIGGHDYVKEVAHFQETGSNSKDTTTTTSNSKTSQSVKRGDTEISVKEMAQTDECVAVKEKNQLETTVCAQRGDEGDNNNASLDILMPTAESEVSPISKQASQPKCDSSEVKKQLNEATEAESSKEPNMSPISEKTSQLKCGTPELEEATSAGVVTRDDVDASSVEKLTELAAHSQQSLYNQQASSTGSGDSSWSKLSEEANDSKAKPSLSKSSSSSSGVFVPSVDDKDIEWDNDLDLDEDISEEEMKKIMESLGSNDLGKLGDLDLDDEEWDSWQ